VPVAYRRVLGRCGATLMGDRVTGVRVTPISGSFEVRGGAGARVRIVAAGPGSSGGADVSAGGGGGGAGARLLVTNSADVDVVAVGAVVSAVGSSAGVPPGGRNTSSTADMTRATDAATAATRTVSARVLRYQGGGAGSKYQVSALNASNPLWVGSTSVVSTSAHTSSGW
jgi:hypothetical protein